MKLLLDEMYPPLLVEALASRGMEAMTASTSGLTGNSDANLLSAAVAGNYVLLTENVSDFARLAGDHLAAGGHHLGVLIALSSRFSRRPSGVEAIAAAVDTVAHQDLADRLVYLARPAV